MRSTKLVRCLLSWILASIVLFALQASSAWAAEGSGGKEKTAPPAGADKSVKKKAAPAKKKEKQGFIPNLDLGFNLAMSQTQNITGVPDGTTMALGLNLKGGLVYRKGPHQWITTLDVIHTQTKVPNLEVFIKSADKFDLESSYVYTFSRPKWISVFGTLKLSMPLLRGSMVLENDTDLILLREDGSTATDRAESQKPYQLTKFFSPLVFKQFAGASFLPMNRKYLSVFIKTGPVINEVWVRGSYVKDDDSTTPELELRQLEDYVQAGYEVEVLAKGMALDKILTYSLKVGLMYPFYTSIDTELEKSELFHVELKFDLGIKLWKWASIKYALSAIRMPFIQKEWQVINSILLSVTASIVK